MAIVGSVGFDGPFGIKTIVADSTLVIWKSTLKADANGYVNTIKIGGQQSGVPQSAWIQIWRLIGSDYTFIQEVAITVPAGEGPHTISLPSSLSIQVNDMIGMYINAIMKPTTDSLGTARRAGHIYTSFTFADGKDTILLYADIEDTPLPPIPSTPDTVSELKRDRYTKLDLIRKVTAKTSLFN